MGEHTKHQAQDDRQRHRQVRAVEQAGYQSGFRSTRKRDRCVQGVTTKDCRDAVDHNVTDNAATDRGGDAQRDSGQPVQTQVQGLNGAGCSPASHAHEVDNEHGSGRPAGTQIDAVRKDGRNDSSRRQ